MDQGRGRRDLVDFSPRAPISTWLPGDRRDGYRAIFLALVVTTLIVPQHSGMRRSQFASPSPLRGAARARRVRLAPRPNLVVGPASTVAVSRLAGRALRRRPGPGCRVTSCARPRCRCHARSRRPASGSAGWPSSSRSRSSPFVFDLALTIVVEDPDPAQLPRSGARRSGAAGPRSPTSARPTARRSSSRSSRSSSCSAGEAYRACPGASSSSSPIRLSAALDLNARDRGRRRLPQGSPRSACPGVRSRISAPVISGGSLVALVAAAED